MFNKNDKVFFIHVSNCIPTISRGVIRDNGTPHRYHGLISILIKYRILGYIITNFSKWKLNLTSDTIRYKIFDSTFKYNLFIPTEIISKNNTELLKIFKVALNFNYSFSLYSQNINKHCTKSLIKNFFK